MALLSGFNVMMMGWILVPASGFASVCLAGEQGVADTIGTHQIPTFMLSYISQVLSHPNWGLVSCNSSNEFGAGVLLPLID